MDKQAAQQRLYELEKKAAKMLVVPKHIVNEIVMLRAILGYK